MGMGDKIAYLVDTREGGNKSNFARKIGMKNPTSGLVYGWITGKNLPSGEYQLKICEAYGISIKWLQDDNIPVDPPIMTKEPARSIGGEGVLMAELRAQIEDLKKDKEDLKGSVRSLLENNKILAEAAGKKIGSSVGVHGVRSKVRV
jgi:transcriptional regulator with XRE-family HTH domain